MNYRKFKAFFGENKPIRPFVVKPISSITNVRPPTSETPSRTLCTRAREHEKKYKNKARDYVVHEKPSTSFTHNGKNP